MTTLGDVYVYTTKIQEVACLGIGNVLEVTGGVRGDRSITKAHTKHHSNVVNINEWFILFIKRTFLLFPMCNDINIIYFPRWSNGSKLSIVNLR